MLIVGTANFGQSYGIKNNKQLDKTEINTILNYASKSDVTHLDSASQYGKSQNIISEYTNNKFNIITKFASETFLDFQKALGELNSSADNLKPHFIDTVLLHDAENLFSKNADLIYKNLCTLKSKGLIKCIGISVYSPDGLVRILEHYDFDIVQIPINVLDRRIVQNNFLDKIKKSGIEVHARSIFLQGLLLMELRDLPSNFHKWKELFIKFDNWCDDHSISRLEACVQFIKKQDFISKIVVGVDSYDNLVDIHRAYNLKFPNSFFIPSSISSNDEYLVNPTLWSKT
jgi:aryl-alcohol dehydrogenase-like predicted oxidoreductase